MSDILNAEQFEREPSVSIGRSSFKGLSRSLKTDLTQGDLSPIFLEEVLPGDSFNIKTSFVCRMATPVFPVMDNAVVDIWWFYIPTRLVWDKTKEFYGENTTAPWVQTNEYTIPQIKFNNVFTVGTNQLAPIRRGSLMNRLGIPTTLFPGTGSSTLSSGEFLTVSDLPNRSYRLVWNEFFRDQNTEYPVAVYTDSSDRSYSIYHNRSESDVDYGDALLKVNRLHDYFSSCLPGPQKSLTPVPASLVVDKIPVRAFSNNLSLSNSDFVPMHYAYNDNGTWKQTNLGSNMWQYMGTNNQARLSGISGTQPGNTTYPIMPDNLYADAASVTFATVNTLRQAFAIQRCYEQMARTGSRFREIINGFFNVESPDMSIQVPEYLGGKRVPINIDQVLQTSSTDNTSPQGNTAAYSLTTESDDSFVKSFTEPGIILGLAAARVQHTYTGQCRPYWFRKRRYDMYWPQFASLSEQPVYKKFLNTTGVAGVDDMVFGYQEAFADYRYAPNMVSGIFSPISVYDTSDQGEYIESQSPEAGAWTFADHYTMNYGDAIGDGGAVVPGAVTAPSLSPSWMEEPSANIAQTQAVPSEPQFICDFFFDVTATRPMPVRSIPGLIDHH